METRFCREHENALTGLVMTYGISPPVVSALPWAFAVGGALVAACFDLRGRRIPNLLTGPLFLAGMVAAGSTGKIGDLAGGFLGCIVMAAPFVALWLFAGGGAADAKLMGAIGMWLGARHGILALQCVLACGITIGLGWAIVSGRFAEVCANLLIIGHGLGSLATGQRSPRDASRSLPDHRGMLKMPYGLAICAGVCVAALGVFRWHL